MKGSKSVPAIPGSMPPRDDDTNKTVMVNLRVQNERLKLDLKELTKQLETYIEKTRANKQPAY